MDTVLLANRTAACACGNLRVTVTGPPTSVYACCCLECQRLTGAAFGYRAWFPTAQVDGERRTWRRLHHSGRVVEHTFCPSCGTAVFMRGEGKTGALSVSVGCFADPSFAKPDKAYWSGSKPDWLSFPETTEMVGRQ